MTDSATSAATFRRLHEGVLVLPNAWDAASAALIGDAGAPAIATTSAGVAWSLGYPDGEGAPVDEMIAALRRIVRVSPVPVSADIEAGYGDVAATVARVIEAGAVGINLEDAEAGAVLEASEMARRIAAARRTADDASTDLFINARIDAFLYGVADAETMTIERARVYAAAGADGIFVPGVADLATIGRLASAIELPLNVMVGVGAPSVADLAEAGVHRISTGMALAQQAWVAASVGAARILADGDFDALAPGVDYGTLNGLLHRA